MSIDVRLAIIDDVANDLDSAAVLDDSTADETDVSSDSTQDVSTERAPADE